MHFHEHILIHAMRLSQSITATAVTADRNMLCSFVENVFKDVSSLESRDMSLSAFAHTRITPTSYLAQHPGRHARQVTGASEDLHCTTCGRSTSSG